MQVRWQASRTLSRRKRINFVRSVLGVRMTGTALAKWWLMQTAMGRLRKGAIYNTFGVVARPRTRTLQHGWTTWGGGKNSNSGTERTPAKHSTAAGRTGWGRGGHASGKSSDQRPKCCKVKRNTRRIKKQHLRLTVRLGWGVTSSDSGRQRAEKKNTNKKGSTLRDVWCTPGVGGVWEDNAE